MVSRESKKKAIKVIIATGVLAAILAVLDGRESHTDTLERKEAGKGSQKQEYTLDAGKTIKSYVWTVTAEEYQFTQKEKKEVLKKAKAELEKRILGDNKSPEDISTDLHLPEKLQKGAVRAEYGLSDYHIFYPDGTMRELPQKAAMVTVSAELECQGEREIYKFAIQVVPPKKSKTEQLIGEIQKTLEEENKRTGTNELELPQEVNGIKLSWKKKKENRAFLVAGLGMIAAGCIVASEKEKAKKEQKEREQQLLWDYPDILGKLILLAGAGMNVALAWKQIADTYQRRRDEQRISERPAYEEMVIAVYEMQEGVGEVQAYQHFGERCALPEYRKLSWILVQNVRKGSAQIQRLLEEEKSEAYEKQKARIKTAGEEAGTKLLFPMLLMLLVVLIIIMVPAMMSMEI